MYLPPQYRREIRKLPEYCQELKISAIILRIINSVINNQVTIINAGTGSGKTVGVPRCLMGALMDRRFPNHDYVIVSIPTRVNVDYQYNYALKNNNNSNLIGMSHGGVKTPNFDESLMIYSTTQSVTNHLCRLYKTGNFSLLNRTIVMIDEAHHTSTENYILHGLCNWLIGQGCKLKVILATATPYEHNFTNLKTSNVISCEGTQYEIKTHWLKNNINLFDSGEVSEEIISILEKIFSSDEGGDILIFVDGGRIMECINKAIIRYFPHIKPMCLYSGLPDVEINKCCVQSQERKIIISTNIIESGITIDGIVHIIDTLTSREMSQRDDDDDDVTEDSILAKCLISQSSAKQRKGRVGRTRPGNYYPLATEDYFNHLHVNTQNSFYNINKHEHILGLLTNDLNAKDILLMTDEDYEKCTTKLCKMGLLTESMGVTETGKSIASFPFCFSSATILAKIKNNQEISFDAKLFVTIAICCVEAKKSATNVFYVPKNLTSTEKFDHITKICQPFKSTDEITSLVMIFCEMMMESTNRKEWAINNSINQKFLDSVYTNFLQTCKIMKITPNHSDYDGLRNNPTKHVKIMYELIYESHSDMVFIRDEIIYTKYYRLKDADKHIMDKNKYTIDNFSNKLSPSYPTIIALSNVLIIGNNGMSCRIISSCVPAILPVPENETNEIGQTW